MRRRSAPDSQRHRGSDHITHDHGRERRTAHVQPEMSARNHQQPRSTAPATAPNRARPQQVGLNGKGVIPVAKFTVRGIIACEHNLRYSYPLARCRQRLLYTRAWQDGVGLLTDQQVQAAYNGVGDIAADSESLILVDEADREIGHMDKAQCHVGSGVLHRAFSLLIFNRNGELLLQQRSAAKRLWPLYWSNSVCSHPRRTESMESAIHRRLAEELGLSCSLHFLFKFHYHAQFDSVGAERELCSVYVGRCNAPPRINRAEISAWRRSGASKAS